MDRKVEFLAEALKSLSESLEIMPEFELPEPIDLDKIGDDERATERLIQDCQNWLDDGINHLENLDNPQDAKACFEFAGAFCLLAAFQLAQEIETKKAGVT